MMRLIKATLNDAELILDMQRRSFAGLLEKYRDMETNPGNEKLEKVIMRLNQPFTYFYLIQSGDKYVGAIRIVDSGDGSERKRISPLFVLLEYRNKGIAQEAIRLAESIHGADNWALDTILQEEGNCYLYEKMGYRRTGETKVINDKMTLVFYQKQ